MRNAAAEILIGLASASGPAGAEGSAARLAMELLGDYAPVRMDTMGNVIAELGDTNSDEHILLDAHIDEIGMVVTFVDDNGFLHVDRCGGMDRRVVSGSEVFVLGTKKLTGVVGLCSGDENKAPDWENVFIDIGYPADEAKALVPPGSRVVYKRKQTVLLGGRISGKALDDRAGACALIRCVQMLEGQHIPCRLTVLLSSQEELGGNGAKCAAFDIEPTQAISVDVGFAHQPCAPKDKCGDLGAGPMIGFYPVLSRSVTERLCEIADENSIPWQYDVGGSATGTNADGIALSRSGVACGIISIAQRNMHTPAEICDIDDIENTARLLAEYVKSGGIAQEVS